MILFNLSILYFIIASIAFIVWQIHNVSLLSNCINLIVSINLIGFLQHKLTKCLTDWKELYVDDAYWHVLFSAVLLVIMVLWRPTNNNQRLIIKLQINLICKIILFFL